MSETLESENQTNEIIESEGYKKISKLRLILFYSISIILWGVVAVFSLLELNKGKGFLETPWPIFGIILSVFLIFAVIIPLFKDVRSDIRKIKAKQEAKEDEKI